MPTRSPFLRRLRHALSDGLLIGGLVLWLGVIAVGWFSLRQSPKADAGAPAPAGKDQPQPPRTATTRPRGADDLDAPTRVSTDTSTQPDQDTGATTAKTASATSAHENAPKPAAKRPNDSSSAAKAPGMTASAHVIRAQFTSGVEDHEPVDRLGQVFHSHNQSLRHLYYFTELSGLRGQTVTYHWRHAGRAIVNVSIDIGGDRWRVYSSKRLTPAMAGRWTVVLTDDDTGQTLSTASIVYKVP